MTSKEGVCTVWEKNQKQICSAVSEMIRKRNGAETNRKECL